MHTKLEKNGGIDDVGVDRSSRHDDEKEEEDKEILEISE
jgi:hypothetical protein